MVWNSFWALSGSFCLRVHNLLSWFYFFSCQWLVPHLGSMLSAAAGQGTSCPSWTGSFGIYLKATFSSQYGHWRGLVALNWLCALNLCRRIQGHPLTQMVCVNCWSYFSSWSETRVGHSLMYFSGHTEVAAVYSRGLMGCVSLEGLSGIYTCQSLPKWWSSNGCTW